MLSYNVDYMTYYDVELISVKKKVETMILTRTLAQHEGTGVTA